MSGRPPGVEPAWARVAHALVEPFLALLAATLLTISLTLPFVPTSLAVELPLRPSGDAGPITTPEELARRLKALGLADRVELTREDDGTTRLILNGVSSLEAVETPLLGALERGGFERVDLEARRAADVQDLLQKDPRVLPVLMTIQAAILLAAGALLIRWRVRAERSDRIMGFLPAALTGLAGGGAALGISLALSTALSALGLPVEEQEWLRELFADPAALMWLAPWIVLVGPVAEEVFFRGYVLRFVARHLGFAAGVAVSSVMFAAIHFNASGFLIYVAIGCVLAWVYRRTANLVAPIVGHMTINAVVLLAARTVAGG